MLPILTLPLALVLALAGCAGAGPADRVATDEVCAQVAAAQEARPDAGTLAAHRDMAPRLLDVAVLAQQAQDPDLATLGERLEVQARSVLDRLEPGASDEQARSIAEPMLRESVRLQVLLDE
jgi:hypothetical protein